MSYCCHSSLHQLITYLSFQLWINMTGSLTKTIRCTVLYYQKENRQKSRRKI